MKISQLSPVGLLEILSSLRSRRIFKRRRTRGGLALSNAVIYPERAGPSSPRRGSRPVLEGQTFLLIDAPNRYGVPALFFELHVWAWRDNPQGNFVDWNDHVSCPHE